MTMKTTIKILVIISFGLFFLQSYIKPEQKPDISPIEKSEVNSVVKYGKRIHPVFKVERFHEGVDLISKEGTKIISTADGIVEKVHKSNKAYGNMITIKHNAIYTTRYAHLKDIDVKQGQVITKGQKIGTVGNTGLSSGPHLHYEIIKNGQKVDPLDYFSIK